MKFIFLKSDDEALLEQVGIQFRMLHEHLVACGQKLKLFPGGAEQWLNGMRSALGRFVAMVVAVEDERVIGFAQGNLRFTPDYFGALKVGLVSHLYVVPQFRGQGIGTNLLTKLEEWLTDKGIHSLEVQTAYGNDAAAAFWADRGYEAELVQFRKKTM